MIYVAILAVAVIAITRVLIVMTRSYTSIVVARDLNHSALVGFEAMVREIRGSASVTAGSSTLGAHPGRLTTAAGATTTEFYMAGTQLMFRKNGVVQGPLTLSTARVTNLVFRQVSTGSSEAIKIEMTLAAGTSTAARSVNLYSTAILRGSY